MTTATATNSPGCSELLTTPRHCPEPEKQRARQLCWWEISTGTNKYICPGKSHVRGNNKFKWRNPCDCNVASSRQRRGWELHPSRSIESTHEVGAKCVLYTRFHASCSTISAEPVESMFQRCFIEGTRRVIIREGQGTFGCIGYLQELAYTLYYNKQITWPFLGHWNGKRVGVNAQSEECSVPCEHSDNDVPNKG